MSNVKNIGYDPGFNANKIAQIQEDQIITYVLPSSVGLAHRQKKDGLTLAGVVRPHKINLRPFRVSFDGLEYLVGPNVGDYTEPLDRMDFDRFTDSLELRATLYAALFQFLKGGQHEVALAIALPVEVVQNRDEALRVERAMRGWLVGEHAFCVDDTETVIIINRIRAKIPQPVATWFDWGMDTQGQWIRGKDAQRAPTLIIDQGFNTLDVLVVEAGQISERLTEGDTLGMSRAAETLIQMIKNRYDLNLELAKANELIQASVDNQPVQLYLNGQLINIASEAKQAVQALGVDVDNFLTRSIGRATGAHKVLLTGGGALAMAPRLLRRFPDAIVMHEPVLANARGLAKLATRPGFLS